ncbi:MULTISPECIES: hypothetical protein [Snodgrassella]|uniref:hypothetical protein n=1 Tax=Snodgrassella TaxID=1193515 RepID=UPI000C1F58A7|nr:MULTISPECIES: hypothetical protein [Snodgrassella]MCX8746149.1 hypothetical protein [Snodgrassella sp. B3800]MCX8748050.1 hypothetical protein [Snodgrassella sp. B3088]MCX8752908.1 hypothetical protein [Snodgrassella sp. B3837]
MKNVEMVLQLLYSLLDLRFLPDKLQKWLFHTGTRVITVTSALIMIGFAGIFLLGGSEVFNLKLYKGFLLLHPLTLSVLLIGMAVLQLLVTIFKSNRCNVLCGYLLILSALIWAVISATFWASYPPLTTGMTTYPVLAVVCALAGRNQINYTKRVEDLKHKGR